MMANRNFGAPFYGAEQELLFPGVVAKGATGKAARRVQEWLVYHGATRIVVDGEFGPATERALLDFQVRHGIIPTANGALDEITWQVLTAPLARAMRPIDGTGHTLNEMVCLYARQHIAEHPVEIGGPNAGPWVRAYMLGGDGKWAKWCAGFVSFVLAQACAAKGVPLPFRPSFGATELAWYAKAKGRFSADGPAVPGDVFVIPDSTTTWFHTGFVLDWRGAEKFVSAEGNTNIEGSADGTVARSALRNPARCDFIRVGP